MLALALVLLSVVSGPGSEGPGLRGDASVEAATWAAAVEAPCCEGEVEADDPCSPDRPCGPAGGCCSDCVSCCKRVLAPPAGDAPWGRRGPASADRTASVALPGGGPGGSVWHPPRG